MATIIGLLVWLDLNQSNDIAEFQSKFEAAGGYVAVVSSPGTPIHAGRCSELQSWKGVKAAGALMLTGTVSFTSAPDALYQSARVTAGILRGWFPNAALPFTGGYVIGWGAARELGLREDSYIAAEGGSVARVAYVLPAVARNPRAERWIVDVTPANFPAEECWVVFDRMAFEPGMASLPAWFATGTNDVSVHPYLRRDGFTRDVSAEFANRPQRMGWLAAGGIIAALLSLSIWFRRAELGLYLAIGTPRVQLITLILLESAALVGMACVIALAWAMGIERLVDHPLPWDHIRLATRSGVSAALLGLLVGPLVSQVVVRGSLQSLLKDR